MKKILFLIVLVFSVAARAQESDFVLHTPTGDIYGTIAVPKTDKQMPLVLLIAGSGPTDRNCNQTAQSLKTDAFKMLADSLLKYNIASLRFDKRGIGESAPAMTKEDDLRFDTYINDVKAWIDTLAKNNKFSKIVVAGHSEGSLIGMAAAVDNAKTAQYISISGVAVAADEILKEQLATQPQEVKDMVFPMLDTLKAGRTIADVNPMFYSLFRPSIQPYMISWMRRNPQAEIAKLKIPILIIQGTTDIQVSENQAKLLHSANPKSTLVIIKEMNHVLKTCATTDQAAQMATYASPDFPLADGFVKAIVEFVKQ
ncbi:MAG: alpha/beta hydrolase [Paludibacter sp.]|jgi:alpha-beta hydrolase superfamily lysophospholipase|nr:alpha/beta hydrolase [Paludibacter sp.]